MSAVISTIRAASSCVCLRVPGCKQSRDQLRPLPGGGSCFFLVTALLCLQDAGFVCVTAAITSEIFLSFCLGDNSSVVENTDQMKNSATRYTARQS